MNLRINGEDREVVDGLSLRELITQLNLAAERIAIELNHNVVRRDDWPATALKENDQLEIVHFVGGGRAGGRRQQQEAGGSSRRQEAAAGGRRQRIGGRFGLKSAVTVRRLEFNLLDAGCAPGSTTNLRSSLDLRAGLAEQTIHETT
ncbi:hypothetical protein BH18ACI4_BH18ACI4_29340 [soil metagenome]